ncbi:MAG TPA: tetratricopeptide repeat protein [Steroidobacteraceae bacterium]|nr:tetratricopeptide repeat protein [Steroidobacteraceae bacterium]
MPEEYLTDDEQLEEVKRLAGEYGPWIIGAVALGLAFVAGYRYYHHHIDERAMKAAAQFHDLTSAVSQNDPARALLIADALIKNYAGSPYADQAQLMIARLSLDQGQDENAIAPLTEVIEHSKDSELKHIARLRLARVQVDQGKPDEALKTLSDSPGAFAARYHEVRGDALFAKKDLRGAADEYRAALAEAAAGSMDGALVALKIADLGLPAATAPPAPTQAKP